MRRWLLISAAAAAVALAPAPPRKATRTARLAATPRKTRRAAAAAPPMAQRAGATRRAAAGGLLAAAAAAAVPAAARGGGGGGGGGGAGLRYVAVARDVAQKPTLAYRAVEARYGLRFVEYLARLLLVYDGPSREWWETKRRAAAGEASGPAKEAARYAAYASFVASTELSLARSYLGSGDAALLGDLGDRALPKTIAARRQLALLAALSATPLPGTAACVAASANGTVVRVEVLDRGAGYDPSRPPKIVVGGAAARFDDGGGARLRAVTRPSGRLAAVTVADGGAGYDAAPAVAVYRPAGRSPPDAAPARCSAVVENGSVVRVVVEDPGAGYDVAALGDAAATIVIAAPPRSGPGETAGRGAAGAPGWDHELDRVDVADGGAGFDEGGLLDVGVAPPPPSPFARAATARAALGPGERPGWSYDVADGRSRRQFRAEASSLARLLPPQLAPTLVGGRYVVAELAGVAAGGDGFDDVFGPRSSLFVEEDRGVSPYQYAVLGLCGAVCTSAAHVALTPLEVVKTRIQTAAPTEAPAEGPVAVARGIYDDRGLAGLFAGADAIALGYLINGFLGFGLTELFKRSIAASIAPGGGYAWTSTVLGALGAAVAATTAVVPFEAAKVRMVAAPSQNGGLVETWRDLAAERGGVYEGVFGRGLPVLVAKDLVFAAFKFAVFDYARGALYGAYPLAAESLLGSFAVSTAAGAVAGAVGAVASQPIDVAFAKVETDPECAGLGDALASAFASGGVAGLFAGVATRALFAALLLAIEFAIFEALRDAFHVSRDDFSYALDALASARASAASVPVAL